MLAGLEEGAGRRARARAVVAEGVLARPPRRPLVHLAHLAARARRPQVHGAAREERLGIVVALARRADRVAVAVGGGGRVSVKDILRRKYEDGDLSLALYI